MRNEEQFVFTNLVDLAIQYTLSSELLEDVVDLSVPFFMMKIRYDIVREWLEKTISKVVEKTNNNERFVKYIRTCIKEIDERYPYASEQEDLSEWDRLEERRWLRELEQC